MYLVSRSSDEKYGNVIAILRVEDGVGEVNPFHAVEDAKREKRLWQEQEGVKSRFTVDRQILTVKQLEIWAREEYQHLPKCSFCASILSGEVHTNTLADDGLFCSVVCADRDYHQQMDRMNDNNEEECDL